MENLARKAVNIKIARQLIAQTAAKGTSALLLYAITDLAEQLQESFNAENYFPFDWSDNQSELFYKLMRAQSQQKWSGMDLKIITLIFLNPCSKNLDILFRLFKRLPKNLNLSWDHSPQGGDMCLAPKMDTPCVPDLLHHGTPETPDEFVPLTQCLDPRSNVKSNRNRLNPVPKFSLNLSTISAGSPNQSTPDKSPPKCISPANRSITPVKRSPITKPRKRLSLTPSPKEIRARNSRILDGHAPPPKRTKLDKSQTRNRPRVRARRSLKLFLANLFQQ